MMQLGFITKDATHRRPSARPYRPRTAVIKPLARCSRAALFACLYAVVAMAVQGVAQHWHAPVHLAEAMQPAEQAEQGHNDGTQIDHHCLTCNLLKAGQVASLANAYLPLPAALSPFTLAPAQIAANQPVPVPSARGPPVVFS